MMILLWLIPILEKSIFELIVIRFGARWMMEVRCSSAASAVREGWNGWTNMAAMDTHFGCAKGTCMYSQTKMNAGVGRRPRLRILFALHETTAHMPYRLDLTFLSDIIFCHAL